MAAMTLATVYYIDLKGLDNFSYQRDRSGIPIVNYGAKIGYRYNPITISQYGLSLLRSPHQYKMAFTCADWLVENLRPWQSNMHAWIYDFDLEFYGPRAPWISAMAQGEGISLLLRVFQLSKEEKYLQAARLAFSPFQYTIKQKGIVDEIKAGAVFFEEYVTEPASHVLNGHIFSLLGVYDYWRFFDNSDAAKLLRNGMATVRMFWPKWDCGYWTRYDLYPLKRLASPMYHRLHIRLMRGLAQISGDKTFLQVAERWQNMLNSPCCSSRWFFSKCYEKIRLLNLKK